MSVRPAFFRMTFCVLLAVVLVSMQGCATKPPTKPIPSSPAGVHIAMLLPSSGPLSGISSQIYSGAQIAAQELNTNGKKVSLKLIPSDKEWVEPIRNLPSYYTIVGGAMEERTCNQLAASGLFQQKTFFAFTSKLPSQLVEGRDVWRFYSSNADQAKAIVKLCSGIGIHAPVALSPMDEKSKALVGALEEELQSKGIELRKAFYDASNPSSIQGAVDSLCSSSSAPIEAIFLPSLWGHVPAINAQLVQKKMRPLLIGSMYWSVQLASSFPQASSYPLVIFPSSFYSTLAHQVTKGKISNTWAALGYDFVRFAERMNIHTKWPSDQISLRAQQSAMMNFAMAPLSYSRSGVASQRLIMLQPGPAGPVLLDQTTIIAKRKAAEQSLNLPEEAVVTYDEMVPYTPSGSSSTQSAPVSVAPATQRAPKSVPAVKPGGSYKLRLPSAATPR